jgi:hypothetical protein
VRVRLLPDGRIALPGAGKTGAAKDGRWHILGSVRQDGRRMAFVRAEIGGESWAALIELERLRSDAANPLVRLKRQSSSGSQPLTGWLLFC